MIRYGGSRFVGCMSERGGHRHAETGPAQATLPRAASPGFAWPAIAQLVVTFSHAPSLAHRSGMPRRVTFSRVCNQSGAVHEIEMGSQIRCVRERRNGFEAYDE